MSSHNGSNDNPGEGDYANTLKLADLSRVMDLGQHSQDIIHEIQNQSDRGAALVLAAVVETSLGRAIRTRLVHFNNVEDIFTKEGAPLGTFSAKTQMARALGVIGPESHRHLDAIRHIRNQFAHSALKIDFQTKAIAARCTNLLPDDTPEIGAQFSPQRRRYQKTAILLEQALEHVASLHIQDTHEVWLA